MRLYAEMPQVRARQLLQDMALVLWIVLWLVVGFKVNALVNELAQPGETIERAGSGFASSVEEIGGDVGDVPLFGEELRRPFEAVAGAGRVLEEAGQTQQDLLQTLALWLGVLFAVIPISYVLYRYVPDRLRWIREAGAARRLRIDADDLRLFALRAMATRPLYELRRAAPDPAAAFEAGDYETLAGLELAALGLRTGPPG
jgi:hypothetical protein